jgi:hypothetical protein
MSARTVRKGPDRGDHRPGVKLLFYVEMIGSTPQALRNAELSSPAAWS